MALLGHVMPAAPMGSFFLDFESGLPPVEPAPPMQVRFSDRYSGVRVPRVMTSLLPQDTNKRKEPPGAPSRAAGAAVAANTGAR
jgi:hypothetical protein